MVYEPRESIDPRTFSLRHLLLEELKLRQQRPAGEGEKERLADLARALDVAYDAAARHFIVSVPGGPSCQVPWDSLLLYRQRVDTADGEWQRQDEILRVNRALAARLIDQLSFAPPG